MNLEELTPESLRALRNQVGDVARERIDAILNGGTTAVARAPFPGRFEITLPWSALAPDNLNTAPIGDEGREKRATFKAAKLKATELLDAAYDAEPFAGPARVVFTFWFPDNRARDPVNFGKALLDAMKGVVVTDDKWQVCRSVTFDGEDVDRDRPRCEVVVTAMAPKA